MDKKATTETAQFLSDMQSKLREQAQSLATRMGRCRRENSLMVARLTTIPFLGVSGRIKLRGNRTRSPASGTHTSTRDSPY